MNNQSPIITSIKNIAEVKAIDEKFNELSKKENIIKKSRRDLIENLNKTHDNINITYNQVEDFVNDVANTYFRIQKLDEHYKEQKGFSIHNAKKSKIISLDDIKQIHELEKAEIIDERYTGILEKSLVYSNFKKEQYLATDIIFEKNPQTSPFLSTTGISAAFIIGGIIQGDPRLIYGGIAIAPATIAIFGLITYNLTPKNNFDTLTKKIKKNTIEKTKEFNSYLSKNINPEEYFRTGSY
ncbi:hypothetical protein K9L97_00330 [Candidatus Woesearchaeota archaeon]|nr:hypothetical protein [Candidatus Woesearchaeota archaeon]